MKKIFFKLLIIIVFVFQFSESKAQFEEEFSGIISGLYYNASDWGDYDNDGDLDLIITGQVDDSYVSEYHTKIYENTGSGFSEVYIGQIIGVSNGTVKWGDYDNDNDLDVLVSGSLITKIYQNTGNGFTEVYSGQIFGMDYCNGDWGDYDNDGDLDIILTGYYLTFQYDPKTQIFENTGSGFIETLSDEIDDNENGYVDWSDYDNDGDLDILITGIRNYNDLSTSLYQNVGSQFTEVYTNTFAGVTFGSTDWGDYDNDGDLDLVLTGSNSNSTGSPITKIYQNTGTDFVEVFQGDIEDVELSDVKWGDYDNDGDLDILLCGNLSSARVSKIYNNNGAGFDEVFESTLENVSYGSVAWVDYNNDGSLDIFISGETDNGVVSKLYKNTQGSSNNKPTAPTNLTTEQQNSYTVLKWDKSTDAETPQDGLSYNIYIYEENQSNYSVSPQAFDINATDNGKRLISKKGSIQWSVNGYKVLLPACGKKYFWSVQAIDAGLQGGLFASEAEFTVSVPDLAEIESVTDVNMDGFTINWSSTSCATNYYLDIATDNNFSDILTAYNNKEIGTSGIYEITDLDDDVTYYCRIRAENQNGLTSNSSIVQVRTGVFEKMSAFNLKGLYHEKTKIEWNDVDYDGDVDLLINGNNHLDTSYTAYIYENNSMQFNETGILYSKYDWGGFADWGDFNLDNQIDMIYISNSDNGSYSHIYQNSGNVLSEVYNGSIVNDVYEGSVSWGDYNNDGAPDIVITGYKDGSSISKIYENTGSGFNEALEGNLEPITNSTIDWGDFDNDGDLDLLLTGDGVDGYVSAIYQNNITNFSEVYEGSLEGVIGSGRWVDYNSDGKLDVFITGRTSDGSISKLYKNTGSGFNEVFEGTFDPQNNGYVSWGDFDNDGDLDILLTGPASPKLYLNNGDSFSEIYIEYFGIFYGGTSDWGDYDNDGDLDVVISGTEEYNAFTYIFKNNIEKTNELPTAPQSASSVVNDVAVTLTWDKSTDTETQQEGLKYNILVYKDNSKYKARSLVAKVENMPYSQNGYTLNDLSNGTYYWKVQAFDTGLQGGEFSEEQSFVIGASNENTYYEEDSICDGEVYTFGTQELTTAGEYTETFTASDNSDSTVVLTLTVNPVYDLTENVSVCEGSSYTFPDGTVESDITAQIEHTSNLQTIFGCDSIITTTVDVTQGETYNLTEEYDICEGEDYTFPDGSTEYNIQDTMVYTSNLISVGGCDSIIETTLNIKPLPIPAFTYVCDSVFVIFTNETEYGENYLWHFGDGESSFLTNPTHTYPELGKFEVRIKALNECGSAYFSDSILVEYTEPTGLNDIANNKIKVYPNPASEQIYIDYDQELSVEFYNLVGIKVLEAKQTEINISDLKSGTYLVLIRNEFGELIQKVKVIKR